MELGLGNIFGRDADFFAMVDVGNAAPGNDLAHRLANLILEATHEATANGGTATPGEPGTRPGHGKQDSPVLTVPRTPAFVAALSQDLAVILAERSRGAGFTGTELPVAADIIVDHLVNRGLLGGGIAPRAMAHGVAAYLTARSKEHGFDFVDLDVAADLGLDWLRSRGLLALSDLPITVMVLTEHWPGVDSVTSTHIALTDAQIAARAVVAARGRAVHVGCVWTLSVDAHSRTMWRWVPIVNGAPAGRFTITETSLT